MVRFGHTTPDLLGWLMPSDHVQTAAVRVSPLRGFFYEFNYALFSSPLWVAGFIGIISYRLGRYCLRARHDLIDHFVRDEPSPENPDERVGIGKAFNANNRQHAAGLGGSDDID